METSVDFACCLRDVQGRSQAATLPNHGNCLELLLVPGFWREVGAGCWLPSRGRATVARLAVTIRLSKIATTTGTSYNYLTFLRQASSLS